MQERGTHITEQDKAKICHAICRWPEENGKEKGPLPETEECQKCPINNL